MKKILGYALAFTIGTMVSGSVVFAASNYVQAQRNNSNMIIKGETVSSPPSLIYSGSTYVQLYSLEYGLRKLGYAPSWDGTNFVMDAPLIMYGNAFVNTIKPTMQDMQLQFVELKNANPSSYTSQDYQNAVNSINNLEQEEKNIVQTAVLGEQEEVLQTDLLNALADEIDSLTFMKGAIQDGMSGDTSGESARLNDGADFAGQVAVPAISKLQTDLQNYENSLAQ